MTPLRLSLVPREPDNDIEPATGGQAVPASAVEHSPEVAVAILAVADRQQRLRILEALLFAASEPLDEGKLGSHLKEGDDIAALLVELPLTRTPGKMAVPSLSRMLTCAPPVGALKTSGAAVPMSWPMPIAICSDPCELTNRLLAAGHTPAALAIE